jgi:hypothetical protein
MTRLQQNKSFSAAGRYIKKTALFQDNRISRNTYANIYMFNIIEYFKYVRQGRPFIAKIADSSCEGGFFLFVY